MGQCKLVPDMLHIRFDLFTQAHIPAHGPKRAGQTVDLGGQLRPVHTIGCITSFPVQRRTLAYHAPDLRFRLRPVRTERGAVHDFVFQQEPMLCQIPVEAAQLPAQRIGYTAGRAFAPDLAQQVQVSVSQGGKTGIPGPPGRKAPAQAVGPARA